jgi:hypothetical protein
MPGHHDGPADLRRRGQLVGEYPSGLSFVKAAASRAAFASATRFRPAFNRSMMTLIPNQTLGILEQVYRFFTLEPG